MRVLVTGSQGFVGRWLSEHLAQRGDDSIGLDAGGANGVDITDAEALREAVTGIAPDAIVHLAAQASVGRSWADEAGTFSVNAVGVLNLLAAARACRPAPRVLLVSSAEVYGLVRPEDLPLTETAPLAPASPYAASKAAAEMLGIQAWLGSGLEVIRVRPFNHTGPGQREDFVVPSLARQISDAAAQHLPSLSVGNLSARRDLTDVRDIVAAYRDLLEDGTPGEVYNVCRGQSVPIEEVAQLMLKLAGLNIPMVVDPSRIRPVDLPDLRGDPSRLRAATGWQPRIPLEETLTDVLASYGIIRT